MFKKLLFIRQKPLQLILTSVGSFIGFSLILFAFQAYLDVSELLTPSAGVINPQYIIINKSISVFNSLQDELSVFSEQEIEHIRNNSDVKKIAGFTSGSFASSAYTDGGMNGKFIPFSTDLFFEALPDEFVDVKTGAWRWSEGQEDVPIIIPNDYLNLYNFGFAPSQGLPQLSKGTIQLANFVVKIEGNGKQKTFTGHIVGFTDRINSILVPQTFMDYANKNFGDGTSVGHSRLVLVTKDPDSSKLMKFIADNGYETNTEDQRNAKFFSITNIIFSIVLIIGAVIVLLGLMSFVQYGQLLVARSDYELKTLLQLGYKHQHLSKAYLLYFLRIYSLMFLLALFFVVLVKIKFNSLLTLSGFDITGFIDLKTFVFGLILCSVLFIINASIIRKSVKDLA